MSRFDSLQSSDMKIAGAARFQPDTRHRLPLSQQATTPPQFSPQCLRQVRAAALFRLGRGGVHTHKVCCSEEGCRGSRPDDFYGVPRGQLQGQPGRTGWGLHAPLASLTCVLPGPARCAPRSLRRRQPPAPRCCACQRDSTSWAQHLHRWACLRVLQRTRGFDPVTLCSHWRLPSRWMARGWTNTASLPSSTR